MAISTFACGIVTPFILPYFLLLGGSEVLVGIVWGIFIPKPVCGLARWLRCTCHRHKENPNSHDFTMLKHIDSKLIAIVLLALVLQIVELKSLHAYFYWDRITEI